jgi:hypothetical protein
MKIKTFLIAIICMAALFSIQRVYYFQNGGFCTFKLISNLPPQMNIPPPEIDPLLEQTFHFLGRGGTSFVFLGEDKKTVLKLFKHQHLLQKSRLFLIALPGVTDVLRIYKILKAQKKQMHKHQSFFFSSCNLAYHELKQETGLIYLCLQPNPHFIQPVKLIDAWGFVHNVPLCKTEFAVQHKADLFFCRLNELLASGRKEGIKQAIDALFQLIHNRCCKGIGDRDPNLLLNFGFLDNIAIEFDLGSYFPNPSLKNPLAEAKELFFSTYSLQKWLEKHCPELLNYLLDRIAKASSSHENPYPS